jgi:hypothetical protein
MSDIIQTLKKEKEALEKSIEKYYDIIRPVIAKVKKIDELLEIYERTEATANRDIVRLDLTTKNEATIVEPQNTTNKDMTMQGAIIEALRAHGKFVKAVHFYMPIYNTKTPTTEQKNSISSALNAIRKSGRIDRFKKDNNNNLTFWGLKEWMRDDGTPDKRYVDDVEVGLGF